MLFIGSNVILDSDSSEQLSRMTQSQSIEYWINL